jgi:hypothetical protein
VLSPPLHRELNTLSRRGGEGGGRRPFQRGTHGTVSPVWRAGGQTQTKLLRWLAGKSDKLKSISFTRTAFKEAILHLGLIEAATSRLQEKGKPTSLPAETARRCPPPGAQRYVRYFRTCLRPWAPRANRRLGPAGSSTLLREGRRVPLWWPGAPTQNSQVGCLSP